MYRQTSPLPRCAVPTALDMASITLGPLKWAVAILLAVWTLVAVAQDDADVQSIPLRTHSLQSVSPTPSPPPPPTPLTQYETALPRLRHAIPLVRLRRHHPHPRRPIRPPHLPTTLPIRLDLLPRAPHRHELGDRSRVQHLRHGKPLRRRDGDVGHEEPSGAGLSVRDERPV